MKKPAGGPAGTIGAPADLEDLWARFRDIAGNHPWLLPGCGVFLLVVCLRMQILVGILYLWTFSRRCRRKVFGDPMADRLKNAEGKAVSLVVPPSSPSTASGRKKKSVASNADAAGDTGAPASPTRKDLGQKLKAKWKKLTHKDK